MNILPNILKLFDYPQKKNRAPLLALSLHYDFYNFDDDGRKLTSNGVAGTFALSELVARTWRIKENTAIARVPAHQDRPLPQPSPTLHDSPQLSPLLSPTSPEAATAVEHGEGGGDGF
ncbi:hypothetical protein V501_07755 [Pseudogymnoascus sp. VKM F-4519 (FW-2642)]|nr:hypothetical protein V501_07755 [Pseudogymnoascus sp. VKM F-4519 (FW-2642)]